MNIFSDFHAKIIAAAKQLGLAEAAPFAAITLERPRDPAHGDLATNAAMVLAKSAGKNPRELATALITNLQALPGVAACEIAGPGFINIRLLDSVWQNHISDILRVAGDYGKSEMGSGHKINVEFVSANPTGPMHMGHCRGAVVGDALAELLKFAGYGVAREYYINDAGSQVDTLARSAHLRYREALGETIGDIPDGYYPGDYLVPVGAALAAEFGDAYQNAPESEWLDQFKRFSVAKMMDRIRQDLAQLDIHHDVFSSEQALHDSGAVDAALNDLAARDLIYVGTLEKPKGETSEEWEAVPLTLFRASQFGDDADRPMKKSDGSWTYFGADVAYHRDKISRGFDQLINIWGADHSGAIKRLKSAVAALTENKVPLDVQLVQMVRLLRGGEPLKMSKRAGNFVTLGDVVDEVGKDVVRFMMLTRKSDSQLDFDFAKVKEQSRDNPVFYVQYAHARICSAQRKADETFGSALPMGDPYLLVDSEEAAMVKLLWQWPRTVESAAQAHEPHRIAFFLGEVAAAFHSLYNRGNDDPSKRFILPENPAMTASRLALCQATAQVLRNGLALMGVEAATELRSNLLTNES
jgi:arginyl-tRNA synthetase